MKEERKKKKKTNEEVFVEWLIHIPLKWNHPSGKKVVPIHP